ncbi:MAG TPA: DUF928 domain-containing protein [Candidatus Sericytochromatia bacterium]
MNHLASALLKQQIVTKLLAGMVVGLCFMPAIALADDDKAPPSGRSSGGRGCGSSTLPAANVPALILITPEGQSGQTVSTRPTFAWFVRDAAPVPLEFRLYEQDGDRFVLVQAIKDDRLRSAPGIMVLSADDGLPELTVGKRYRWQVELVCNPSRPSSNLFAEATMEVVPLQAGLKTQLARSRDQLDRAKLYAQANLWYDVLKTAFTPLRTTTQLQALRLSVLDQVALNPMERQLLKVSDIHLIQR